MFFEDRKVESFGDH